MTSYDAYLKLCNNKLPVDEYTRPIFEKALENPACAWALISHYDITADSPYYEMTVKAVIKNQTLAYYLITHDIISPASQYYNMVVEQANKYHPPYKFTMRVKKSKYLKPKSVLVGPTKRLIDLED